MGTHESTQECMAGPPPFIWNGLGQMSTDAEEDLNRDPDPPGLSFLDYRFSSLEPPPLTFDEDLMLGRDDNLTQDQADLRFPATTYESRIILRPAAAILAASSSGEDSSQNCPTSPVTASSASSGKVRVQVRRHLHPYLPSPLQFKTLWGTTSD